MNTIRTYTGNGVDTLYPVDFTLGFIRRDFVYVYTGDDYTADNVDYVWINDTQIQLTNPTALDGIDFYIRRVVPKNELANEYTDRSLFKGKDVNNSYRQALMILEEIDDLLSPIGDSAIRFRRDIDMDGFKIFDLPEATSDTEPVRKQEWDTQNTAIATSIAALQTFLEDVTNGAAPVSTSTVLGDGVTTTFNSPISFYVPAVYMEVYLDGGKQKGLNDYYIELDGRVTFNTPPALGQHIDIRMYVPSVTYNPLDNLTFATVDAMKTGVTLGGVNVNFEELAANKSLVKTKWNNSTSKAGGAEYEIMPIGDYSGTPDGYGDHYIGGGTDYVAKLVVDGNVSIASFGAMFGLHATNSSALQSYINFIKNIQTNEVVDGASLNVIASNDIVFESGAYGFDNECDITGLKNVNLISRGKAIIYGAGNRSNGFIVSTDVRQFKSSNLQYQNFDTCFSLETNNTDLSRIEFENGDADACNQFLTTGQYTTSRSTIITFYKFHSQYTNDRLVTAFCDQVNFIDSWIGHGRNTSLIYGNSMFNFRGGMFIPASTGGNGKCFVYLTNDDGDGGTANDSHRGVYISQTRSSNEGGNCPLVVNDYPIKGAYQQNPVISIRDLPMTAFKPSAYESGGTETGVVHLIEYPAYISFSGVGADTLGAANAKLVSKQSTLTDDPHETFNVHMDEPTNKSAMWCTGESNSYTISDTLRGSINNPDPAIFLDLIENGFIDIEDTATTGQKKGTFRVRTGYLEDTYHHAITFILVLEAGNDFAYASSSIYQVTISGINNGASKVSKVEYTKLHGSTSGASGDVNPDIVSFHFGSGDTGSNENSIAAIQELTVAFGDNTQNATARIINQLPRLSRYGERPN